MEIEEISLDEWYKRIYISQQYVIVGINYVKKISFWFDRNNNVVVAKYNNNKKMIILEIYSIKK